MDSSSQRFYRANIARTRLLNATEESVRRDHLTAHVLTDMDGAIVSQLQHAIAAAGDSWPGINNAIAVSSYNDSNTNPGFDPDQAWFYLCFRNNDLFALLAPVSDSSLDQPPQPRFECALLEPSPKRRNNKPGESRYRGTSSAGAGEASWRITLSEQGFTLRLSRTTSERNATVVLIEATTLDSYQLARPNQSLAQRAGALIKRLFRRALGFGSKSTHRHTGVARITHHEEAAA
ncbi:MAG: hypothetical protein NXH85_06230 [Pseudomonadaceae bacterium]|nr:hypothetical protein [Pseudomonadaceae bacterium]